MTVFICAIFYAYIVIAVNVYRQEIIERANEGYFISYKVKAPFPIKVMVLFIMTAFAVNLFLSIVAGGNETILINVLPAIFFVNLLWRYQRKIKKNDKENG